MNLPWIAAIAARRRRITPLAYLAADSGDGSFSRTGLATYEDATGLVQTAATGVRRNANYVSAERTFLLEDARTNVVLWNRDLTNAAWVKTNITAAKNQVGADGAANAASSITATAPNGTVLQSITLASSQRKQSARVKRLVGSGTIEMTTDNGLTWTAITVTAAWTRVSIPAQTLANPVVGFRIATSGDSIAVDYVQNETGFSATSDIETAGVAVTRNAETFYLDYQYPPRALTLYVRGYEKGAYLGDGATRRVAHIGSNNTGTDARLTLGKLSSGSHFGLHDNGPTQVVSSAAFAVQPVPGDLIEHRITLSVTGAVISAVSVNGGAEQVAATTGAASLASAWALRRLYLTGGLNADNGQFAYTHVIVAPGNLSLAQLRSLAGV